MVCFMDNKQEQQCPYFSFGALFNMRECLPVDGVYRGGTSFCNVGGDYTLCPRFLERTAKESDLAKV